MRMYTYIYHKRIITQLQFYNEFPLDTHTRLYEGYISEI